MKQLRIALIAPPWFTVPPKGYGGIEAVVGSLADGLADRGHDVTLFASGGSVTRGKLETTFEEPPSAMLGSVAIEAAHLVTAYSRWPEFDVIHDHTLAGLIAGACVPTPVVHTIHGPVTEEFGMLYGQIGSRVDLVAISRNQHSHLPANVRATVIPNGIDPGRVPFSEKHGDYLLFCGRVNREKGVVEAIEIAKRAGMKLVMVVKVNEPEEHRYWNEVVAPRLNGVDVEVHHQPPNDVKFELYRDAYATLFPICWPEPFGMVMIESMATGTPVVAFRAGSVPEVIEDGKTGFICDSVDEAAAMIPRIRELDRRDCRDHVELGFNTGLNVLRHEKLYRRVMEKQSFDGPRGLTTKV